MQVRHSSQILQQVATALSSARERQKEPVARACAAVEAVVTAHTNLQVLSGSCLDFYGLHSDQLMWYARVSVSFVSAQTGASEDNCLIDKGHEPILAPVISAVSQLCLIVAGLSLMGGTLFASNSI